MRSLTLLFILLLLPAIVDAQTINFEWDPHPQSSQLKEFRLYQSRTSPVCPQNAPPTLLAPVSTFIGGATTTGSISPLDLGRMHWALTAVATDGTESFCSNEVSEVIRPKPPKINKSTQIAVAPIKGASKIASTVAGLFKEDKNLRIKK